VKSKSKVILARHGETEANVKGCFADSNDIPLTEAGRLQSRELALRLSREFRPEILVSSTFLRARQTSEIIADVLGLETEAIAGIQERNFGCLRGQPYARLGLRDPQWTPEGGESLDDVRRRAVDAIASLRDRYPREEIVVVTHGAVIHAVCGVSVPPNCGIVIVPKIRRSSSSVPDRRPR
jgi:2,3-bisphosphoglycerate-dependent phosphoglycerate mutase